MPEQPNEERAPFFKSWNHWYALVLVVLVVLIVLFSLFTKRFS